MIVATMDTKIENHLGAVALTTATPALEWTPPQVEVLQADSTASGNSMLPESSSGLLGS